MHRLTIRAAFLAAVVAAVTLVAAAATHAVPPSDRYTVTPLVSDVPGVAPLTDLNLENAWGLACLGGACQANDLREFFQ